MAKSDPADQAADTTADSRAGSTAENRAAADDVATSITGRDVRPPIPASTVSRRAAFGAAGLGAVGGLAAGAGLLIIGTRTHSGSTAGNAPIASASTVAGPISVVSWKAARGEKYFVAHRGSGDVYPEHSLPAYQAALAVGARCLEISVGRTSDGQLICLHDLTYDRTTTTTGEAAAQPSTVLRSVELAAPQLGPAWALDPPVRVPLLEEALRLLGGRAVLCLEAKDDAAYPAMMALAESLGLRDSIVVKAYRTSSRIAQAKSAGYPVFGYLGSAADMTRQNITTLAGALDPRTDVLVIPSSSSADQVRESVATGIPVWVFPLHRRAEAAGFFAAGAVGAVCSSYGYISSATAIAVSDTWRSGAIAPGEMTKDPSSPQWAPHWTGTDELTLSVTGHQHFLTLGQFAPLARAAGSYRIEFQASFPELPSDRTSNLSLAFGHADDSYYEHQLGAQSGYHALLRVDGRLQLFEHRAGEVTGRQLGPTVQTSAAVPGQWIGLRLDVDPEQLSWTRLDGPTPAGIMVRDRSHRGGYLHLGRSATDGSMSLRSLTVT